MREEEEKTNGYIERLVRPSASVNSVASLMDMSTSAIRDLVNCGELSGHYAGKGSKVIRIYLDSVNDYQSRREIIPTRERLSETKKTVSKVKSRNTFKQQKAINFLKECGISC